MLRCLGPAAGLRLGPQVPEAAPSSGPTWPRACTVEAEPVRARRVRGWRDEAVERLRGGPDPNPNPTCSSPSPSPSTLILTNPTQELTPTGCGPSSKSCSRATSCESARLRRKMYRWVSDVAHFQEVNVAPWFSPRLCLICCLSVQHKRRERKRKRCADEADSDDGDLDGMSHDGDDVQ